MEGLIFTVGHSNHLLEAFLTLLTMHHIQIVVDVRSHPFSRYLPHFNQQVLQQALKTVGIEYDSMKHQLGGLPVFPNQAKFDYEKMAQASSFIDGIQEIQKKRDTGTTLCLMCAEKDPIDCHRGLLVSRALFERGSEVFHIHFDGTIESHTQMETRLVLRYFPANQVSLFDVPFLEKKGLAYRKQANKNTKSHDEEGG